MLICWSDINQEKKEAEMRDSIEHFKRNSLKKAETNEKSCLPDPSGESFHLPILKK